MLFQEELCEPKSPEELGNLKPGLLVNLNCLKIVTASDFFSFLVGEGSRQTLNDAVCIDHEIDGKRNAQTSVIYLRVSYLGHNLV